MSEYSVHCEHLLEELDPRGQHFSEAPVLYSFLPFQCHLPRLEGVGVCVHGHVQTKPHLISQHSLLSGDTTATAAHYSGQPFSLLKDVTLSELPFKA